MEQFVTSRTVLPGPASVLHLVSSYTPHGVNVRSSQNRTGPEEWAQHFPKTIICVLSSRSLDRTMRVTWASGKKR